MAHAPPQETNINVVVRVRPRNAKEVRENSAVVVTTSGVKSNQLFVKANPSDAQSKTYSFDKVFGPDADQETIYDEVVGPILEEVLMGYNCTIFAYGETGTGKTYTMEGDLESCNGRHAGIIPRTLFKLFEKLEKDDSEYSVQVSCIELYNEELRDLLCNDEATAPKLKIYEDASRRGSNDVHGVEKILVTSAEDVISILQKASFKRQTAATKMNEVSSRSHCIFTITVHIKETTADGEDLLKVGKLNLVDLAGSENVGRSGAERGRAKEAGMINQSLLTLGRVINSLVEKGMHIPYRESKLTRLLQDSLGGKTKTCIVAAVSPAKINIEETLSTLDYAHRAKNIRNKPEVNQRMTKKALIRDYETQIEKLKLDLQATRDKNGIYLAAETYKDLVETGQSRKDRIEEMEKTVQAKEEAILKIQSEFQAQMALLEDTKKKLRGTQEELNVRTKTLSDALGNVTQLTQNLTEQKILTEAHSSTEDSLHTLHSGLVSFMHGTVKDNSGLHAKIERKSAVEISNMRLFNEFQNGILREMSTLDAGIDNFKTASTQFAKELKSGFESFGKTQEETRQMMQGEVDLLTQSILQQMEKLKNSQDVTQTASNGAMESLMGSVSQLRAKVKKQNEVNQYTWKLSWDAVEGAVSRQADTVKDWHGSMSSQLTGLIEVVSAKMAAQHDKYNALFGVASAAMKSEVCSWKRFYDPNSHWCREQIALLKSQKAELEVKLAAHTVAQSQSQNSLMASIALLMSNYTAETQARFSEIHGMVAENVGAATTQAECIMNEIGFNGEKDRREFEEAAAAIADSESCLESCLDAGYKLTSDVVTGVREKLESAATNHQEGLETVTTAFDDGLDVVQQCHSSVLNMIGVHLADTRIMASETTNSLSQHHTNFGDQMDAANLAACGHINYFDQLVETFSDAKSTFFADSAFTISQARNEVQCKRLSLDEPTGQTPCKTKIHVPLDWMKTRDHDEILFEYRQLDGAGGEDRGVATNADIGEDSGWTHRGGDSE
ncbi:P-loop containing nucleoside triphosphate hydrolase protein [Chytriomyces sp. MP71]|nr:P-loop containing nucleoside triphosphate hydrolase protein [Chytriomyces sp. MP71]